MRYEPHADQISSDEVRAKVITQLRTRNSFMVGTIVGCVFLLVGLGMLGGAAWSASSLQHVLKEWPKADATVTKSELTSGRDNDGTMMYGVSLEFRYTINGKEYLTPTSSSYRTSSYTEMKGVADSFVPNTQHAIRYNPENPNDIRYDAAYTLGFFFLPVLLGGMGVVFTAVGGGLWYGFRSKGVGLLCPSCGRPVESDQEFCPHCATPLTGR